MTDLTQRRQFLKLTAATALSGAFSRSIGRSAESISSLYLRIVPASKELDAA